MSNKNSWIPWKDRDDLTDLCLNISYTFYGKTSCDVIALKRKVPNHCLEKIEVRIKECLQKHYVYYYNLTIEVVKLLATDCNKEQIASISRDKLEQGVFFAKNINDIYSILDEIEQLDKGKFLRNNNEWVPWNNREDLENVYLLMKSGLECQVSVEYLENVGVMGISEDAPCYSETSVIFPLGKIPDKFIANIPERSWAELGLYCCSNVWFSILKESELSKTQRTVADNYKKNCESNGYDNDYNYLSILEVVREYEQSDRESFLRNEKNTLSEESIPIPVIDNLSAVPTDVTSDVISVSPYPLIYAKGEDAVPDFTDNSAAGMVIAGNTARAAHNTDIIVDFLNAILKTQQQINMKTRGRITRLEDIPPYNQTNDNWVTAAEFARLKNHSKEYLESRRSTGDKGKDEQGDKGIHDGCCWRAIGEGSKRRIYYYLY